MKFKTLPILLGTFTVLGCLLSNTGSSQLYINEIVASNLNGQLDNFLDPGEDWIEIFNDGGVINMAGYYISDDQDNLTKYQIPFGWDTETFLAPNSHFIIWADKDTIGDINDDEGPTHANFSLSADGETILLVAPDGVTIVDSVTFSLMVDDISYGRETDGSETWMFFNNVTFDDPNGEVVQSPEILFINEVQTVNNSTFQDTFDEYEQWFEIYNPNPYQVNVAGYFISNTSNPLLFQIPNTNPYRTVIPANGFALIWCDGETIEDSNHSSFSLAESGGTITLTSPDGSTLVDTYDYPELDADQSWGRSSDGGVNDILFNIPTPRVSNQIVIIEPELVYINEVLTQNSADTVDNYLEHEDWFEIFNPNNFAIDLSGYYFTDNPENSVKWQVPSTFPDSVTVPANGWLLFWADEDAIQGVRHASFRLNNNLEELSMYSPDGFSLVDHIQWEGMDVDTSLGRITDGAAEWWYFIDSTPEFSNNSGTLELLETAENADVFSVWPNPSSDRIMISERNNISVYSFDGQLLIREQNTISVDLTGLAVGVYVIVTDNGDVARVIKQ